MVPTQCLGRRTSTSLPNAPLLVELQPPRTLSDMIDMRTPCIALQAPLTPQEKVRTIRDSLPKHLFRSVLNSQEPVAWRISPEPFPLSPQTLAAIESLGDDLALFLRMLGRLYARSVKGTAPAFIAEYLEAGKPEFIVNLARHNRFSGDIPGVIRPDLILTENGVIACEIDSVPGGMGVVGAMTHAYSAVGFETVGGRHGMREGLSTMLKSLTRTERPTVAVVVSDECGDYRGELTWMANEISELGICDAYVCAPQDIVFSKEVLSVQLGDGREEIIDVLYRNFELFDLLNVPKSELMLYAARHGRVKMTPSPRTVMEEKLSFALLHHPRLAMLWSKELGESTFGRLRALFPQTWILDPRPVPPQASINGLDIAGEPVNDWMQLAKLGRRKRDYVVKPSGFSELAWGSRGVRIAKALNKEAWEACLHDGLAAYPQTPHILQRFHEGRRVKVSYVDAPTQRLEPLDGRVRLCPYYFVVGGGKTQLGGILATIVPTNKLLIHGMSEAVMAPCYVQENGY
jgi:hypothetical protein